MLTCPSQTTHVSTLGCFQGGSQGGSQGCSILAAFKAALTTSSSGGVEGVRGEARAPMTKPRGAQRWLQDDEETEEAT